MDFSLGDAKSIITPDLARLILESVAAGFGDYYDKVDEQSRAICCATTKAMFINDHMIFHARDRMKNHPSVRFIQRYGRTHLLIDDQLEVKLKKLNYNRRPSNVLTQAVRDFNDQKTKEYPLQLEFPGMLNPVANLIAGYQQNRIKTGIEAVYIVCPQGSRNKWEWKIEFMAEPSKPYAEPISQPPKYRTVTPKKKLAKERTEGVPNA